MNVDDSEFKSPEHVWENRLLCAFARNSRQGKSLANIQPVRLPKGGNFFQMPTPFSASDHKAKPEVTPRTGGGIDILAIVRHTKGEVRLCVMELKDENKPSEPQKDVLKQALAYAIFIAGLLKSKSGEQWWKLFGFSSKLPCNLHIDVTTVMPSIGRDELSEEQIIKLSNGVTLHLHSLFFDENDLTFSGTLKDSMLN